MQERIRLILCCQLGLVALGGSVLCGIPLATPVQKDEYVILTRTIAMSGLSGTSHHMQQTFAHGKCTTCLTRVQSQKASSLRNEGRVRSATN